MSNTNNLNFLNIVSSWKLQGLLKTPYVRLDKNHHVMIITAVQHFSNKRDFAFSEFLWGSNITQPSDKCHLFELKNDMK